MFRVLHGLEQRKGYYTINTVASKGTVFHKDSTDPLLGALATGEYTGFLYQDVTTEGQPTLDTIAGIKTTTAKVGDKVSLVAGPGEIISDVVAEYGDAGAIASATFDDPIAIHAGKIRVAQPGDTQKGIYKGLWKGQAGYYQFEIF